MKAGHLNTQSKQCKQGLCKNIITNLPNGNDSK